MKCRQTKTDSDQPRGPRVSQPLLDSGRKLRRLDGLTVRWTLKTVEREIFGSLGGVRAFRVRSQPAPSYCFSPKLWPRLAKTNHLSKRFNFVSHIEALGIYLRLLFIVIRNPVKHEDDHRRSECNYIALQSPVLHFEALAIVVGSES